MFRRFAVSFVVLALTFTTGCSDDEGFANIAELCEAAAEQGAFNGDSFYCKVELAEEGCGKEYLACAEEYQCLDHTDDKLDDCLELCMGECL